MFAERIGEDARDRKQRMERENAQRQAAIVARDADCVPSEAETVALRQIENQNRRIPLDYAAILRLRPGNEGLFTLLPSDDECRRQLKKLGTK